MNNLKSDIYRGISFEWDDFRFEQAAVREAFYGLLSCWGIQPSDSFIISGCQITGSLGSQVVAAGFISLNGEIFRVEAHSVPVLTDPSNVNYWDVDVSYDSTGTETTEGGTTADTYQIRTASVKEGVAPVNYMPAEAPTLSLIIAKQTEKLLLSINEVENPWLPLTGVNPAFWDVVQPLVYKRTSTGIVVLRGLIQRIGGSGTPGSIIGVVPAAYKPSAAFAIQKLLLVSTVPSFVFSTAATQVRCAIETSGLIDVDLAAIPLNSYIMFDDVMWCCN
jgi:hypothetical protein